MPYIAPNSTVELFGDIGLSDNYTDTYYFPYDPTETQKNRFFNGLTKLGVGTALSYNRELRNEVKLQLPMSQIYKARYMRFKNTSFENKWFYAFVKNVEYINNECSCVHYEIDPMMTWMGIFELEECYIERQHTISDAIGANIADEGIGCGEYICEVTSWTNMFNSYDVAVYIADFEHEDVGFYPIKQGTYVPLTSYFYPLNSESLESLEELFRRYTGAGKETEIMYLKLVPDYWTDTTDPESPIVADFQIQKPYTSIGGVGAYVPRNKKLFTFPYQYLEVENTEGQSMCYMYEYFNTLPDAESTGYCQFQIMGSACTPEINIMCTPKNYKGETLAWDESLNMQKFPSICWVTDEYKAYIAQRDSTLFSNILSNVLVGGTLGAVTGHGVAGAMLGGANSAKTLVSDAIYSMARNLKSGGNVGEHTLGETGQMIAQAMLADMPTRFPSTMKGSAESNLMCQSQNKNFYFRRMSITKNYAMMIDSYFDMFGYAIRQHAVPNMHARPHWTYVKTVDCQVGGAVPADDASKIEQLFNNGIRFWDSTDTIGDYSGNNAPV